MNTKRTIIFSIFAQLLFSLSCAPQEALISDDLFKTWIHSYEEDEDEMRVYRPVAYDFPRSRGRRGMSFQADGVFYLLSMGRSDRGAVDTLQWRRVNKNTLIILDRNDAKTERFRINIVAISDSLLKITIVR